MSEEQNYKEIGRIQRPRGDGIFDSLVVGEKAEGKFLHSDTSWGTFDFENDGQVCELIMLLIGLLDPDRDRTRLESLKSSLSEIRDRVDPGMQQLIDRLIEGAGEGKSDGD